MESIYDGDIGGDRGETGRKGSSAREIGRRSARAAGDLRRRVGMKLKPLSAGVIPFQRSR